MSIITPADVKEFLMMVDDPNDPPAVVNRVNSWIQKRIAEAEEWFFDICKTAWGTPRSRTDIINNARLITWRGRLAFLIYVFYKPIVSITNIEVNVMGSWRTVSNYEVINERGAIYVPVLPHDFANQWHKWKVEYTYGYNEIPNDIKGALIRKVAIEIVNTQQLQILLPTGFDFTKSIEEWKNYITNVITRYANINSFG